MAAKKAIKFYATWCGPCKIYGKTWNRVEEEYKDKVVFEEVDIDKDTTGLAVEYKVDSIPHTVIINEDGSVVEETGRLSYKDLTNLLN